MLLNRRLFKNDRVHIGKCERDRLAEARAILCIDRL